MLNVEKWLNKFKVLSKKSKLKIARLFVEEIKRQDESNEIDKLDELLDNVLTSEDDIHYKETLEDFKELDLPKKREIANTIIRFVREKTSQQEKENMCKELGHSFTDWKSKKRSCGPNDIYITWHSYTVWERSCIRCGKTEVSYRKPQELEDKSSIKKRTKSKNNETKNPEEIDNY